MKTIFMGTPEFATPSLEVVYFWQNVCNTVGMAVEKIVK